MAFPKKHEKSKTRGIRISCVTDEFLKDFYNISAKKGNKDITTYRFQKIDGDIKTVYYPYERAINALKDGWDIR